MYVEEGQYRIQLNQLLKMMKEAVLARPAFAVLWLWLLRASNLLFVLAIVSPGEDTDAMYEDFVRLARQCKGPSKQPQVCAILFSVSIHVGDSLSMLIWAYRRQVSPFAVWQAWSL